jgi:hypothetical protein
MAYQMPTVREILKRLDPKLALQVNEPEYLRGLCRWGRSSRDSASVETATSGL